MCFSNCISPEYCPNDNVTYPCMECSHCNEGNEDSQWHSFNESECDKFHYLLTSFEEKFGINNVKPLRNSHGKHNKPFIMDDLPF